MDKLQKTLLISLISVSATSWTTAHVYQVDMMSAMMSPYSPGAILLFAAVWTAGMAAMMFPAISPVVLLYNRIVKTPTGSPGMAFEDNKGYYPVKMAIFVGSYLAVWSVTGLALLLIWTIPVNTLLAQLNPSTLGVVYGAILTMAGIYQFGPLKARCLGYCESPLSLFMKRWRKGTLGAFTMGTYHGLYCLGCCWPYFLVMVALGWMDIAWMALFAGVIFAEKMWAKGKWVARAAGMGLAIAGALSIFGVIALAPVYDSTANSDGMQMPGKDAQVSPDPLDDGRPTDGNFGERPMEVMPDTINQDPGMKM